MAKGKKVFWIWYRRI